MPAFNFQKQFAPDVESGVKNQTIRACRVDERVPCKEGDTLALYTGMRTKACQKLREAPCTGIYPIAISRTDIFVQDMRRDDLNDFALMDGFKDFNEMRGWFESTHGLPFLGWLIRWSPPSSPERNSDDD